MRHMAATDETGSLRTSKVSSMSAAESRVALKKPDFEILVEKPPAGLIRRYFTTQRHMIGLALGGLVSHVRNRRQMPGKKRQRLLFLRFLAFFARLFLDRSMANQSFPVQLRRRLEILGPTYIKLGQVLSLREDILPEPITNELKNLLDRLPIVRFERYKELLEEGLGRPVSAMFSWIEETPVGSASIAQTHKATTIEGDPVILKLVKPGIKKTLQRDSVLISMFGSLLQFVIPQYQPKRVLLEFADYTLREVDLRREADNAETFSANFKDLPDVKFPTIYRKYSAETVLCMEFFDGPKPDSDATQDLTESERDHLINMGAAAIIRMLYKDGFFHADLHPGNLVILNRTQCGFIDLGMVGRFEDGLRRTLLYYYYCLVIGDAENAARYLASVAQPAKGGNPDGFRRAVEDISRRWHRTANFAEFSLAQLIMESVSLGGKYRIYFPMEMVLMVKALVTFEGVGQLLKPGFDVAEISKKHITKLFLGQFNPVALLKESLRGAPEVVDALVKAPLLVTQGLRFLEDATKRQPENPLSGIRGTLFSGFSLMAGGLILAFNLEHWELSLPFFLITLWLVLRRTD